MTTSEEQLVKTLSSLKKTSDVANVTNAAFDEQLCKTPMLIPPALKKVLSSVKKVDVVDTLDKVLDAVKAYIFAKQLFDSKNPVLINSSSDELGKVLGVEHFSLTEIKRLVLRLLLAENRDSYPKLLALIDEVPGSKRKGSSIDHQSEVIEKKYRPICDLDKSQNVLCAEEFTAEICLRDANSERENDSSSSDEEISYTSENIIAEMYDVEYEIETDNSNSCDSSFSDSDSDIEDILHFTTLAGIALSNDSDEAFLADQSSTDSELSHADDSDEEISNSDKWVCKACDSLNKPYVRICMKCFEERSDWVKGDRNDKKKKEVVRKKKKMSDADFEKREEERDVTIDKPSSSGGSQDTGADDMCIICCERKKRAVLVHGRNGHYITCYKCARRLYSLKQCCPVCRSPIERVIVLESL